ncbi:MAG: ABC transporter permease [Defluviimonas denitrificans]
MLPFWISYIIRTMSWINILGTSGALNSLLLMLGVISEPIQMLYNETTVILGLVHFLLPFMVLNIYVSLEGIDTNLEDAANSLGATRWQSFLQVTLPLSLPGLAAGGLLCFVLGAGTYITPVILGGPRDAMFANLVFEAIIRQLNWPLGSALSLLLLARPWRPGPTTAILACRSLRRGWADGGRQRLGLVGHPRLYGAGLSLHVPAGRGGGSAVFQRQSVRRLSDDRVLVPLVPGIVGE